MAEIELCDFGSFLEEKCHRTHLTTKVGYKKLNVCCEDKIDTLLWRAGMNDISNLKELNICFHHEQKLGFEFENKFKQCCNVFSNHKRSVKGGHRISLQMAKNLTKKSLHCVPGWQLCRSCYTKTLSSESLEIADPKNYGEQSSPSVQMDLDVSEVELHVSQDHSRERINESLKALGQSPVKMHSLHKYRRMAYVNDKIESAVNTVKELFAASIGIEKVEITSGKDKNKLSEETLCKARDLDNLMDDVKEKIKKASSYREKIKLLTLTPESWTVKHASDYFEVTEYLVKRSRKIKCEEGIFAEPSKKKGRELNNETVQIVTRFFEDDEYSRIMPGKKDSISIGRNIHKQKRLLLCNLKDHFLNFKKEHPEVKIGFSKFCSLRPKWCVIIGSSGSHSVCVCSIHQNAILLVDALGVDKTYKNLMDMIVCSQESKICMVHRCKDCPGTAPLRAFLYKSLEENDDEISFKQWQTTNRTNLVTITSSLDEYIDLLINAIDSLTHHSYIAKCQAKYLKQKKENIDETSGIILGDFAENYTFVVQDEIQSLHWSKQSCTLHPVVLYYKHDGKLVNRSFCFISNELEHDTNFVYKIQRELVQLIKNEIPNLKKFEYFSDGCAAQYKNYKNMLNLTFHNEDFGINATWTFFATSHGKSPCDGIGGTVKRLTARASLQRPYSDQILTAEAMFLFCKENIENITFIFITKKDMEVVREELKERFAAGHTIPGTRSFHYFEPIEPHKIAYKRTAEDDSYTGTYVISKQPVINLLENVHINDYIASRYENQWWIGLIQDTNREEQDMKVNFMHPPGPTKNFIWPVRQDVCWVPVSDLILKLEAPTTITGCVYQITDKEFDQVNDLFSKSK